MLPCAVWMDLQHVYTWLFRVEIKSLFHCFMKPVNKHWGRNQSERDVVRQFVFLNRKSNELWLFLHSESASLALSNIFPLHCLSHHLPLHPYQKHKLMHTPPRDVRRLHCWNAQMDWILGSKPLDWKPWIVDIVLELAFIRCISVVFVIEL